MFLFTFITLVPIMSATNQQPSHQLDTTVHDQATDRPTDQPSNRQAGRSTDRPTDRIKFPLRLLRPTSF